MIPLSDVRTYEILINKEWQPVDLRQILRGDVIRMREPDGTLVLHRGSESQVVIEGPAMTVSPYSRKDS